MWKTVMGNSWFFEEEFGGRCYQIVLRIALNEFVRLRILYRRNRLVELYLIVSV